jgi:ribosomal protein S18 acetylase RimI-like enzyme
MTELTLDVTPLTSADLPQIEKLDERAFGPGRFTRTAYRLREGVGPVPALSFVARVGKFLVGANIMTPITCGGAPALLLGPLTVEPAFRSRGIGERLIRQSLDAARAQGHRLVILVGDEPYYKRFGFKRVPMGRILLPGPVDPARVLTCELVDGAFEGVKGPVTRAL